MKPTQYKAITRRLSIFAREADRTREVLTSPAGANTWNSVVLVDTYIVQLMGESWDGYVSENQERADGGLPPTTDFRDLYRAMCGFLVATTTPADGFGVLYPNTRDRVREWVDRANEWFPNLNANKGKPTTPTTIDKDKLGGLFVSDFKVPKPRFGMEPMTPGFDMFYNALVTGGFNKTDLGRIAYQVQHSDKVLSRYRRRTFAEFARLFYDICGVPVPKDLAPNKYKNPGKTDFGIWLK